MLIDVLVPRSYSDVLLAGIAGSELVVVPDAGHLCALEQPALVNNVLRTFFLGVIADRAATSTSTAA